MFSTTHLLGSPQNCWSSFPSPWSIISNFNSYINSKEKFGACSRPSSSRDSLSNFVDDKGLIDLRFNGSVFTWNNKRASKANIQIRLDRGIINASWKLLFPFASITYFTALASDDHRPLLLDTLMSYSSRPKPFRFEEMWLRDSSISKTILNAWSLGDKLEPIAILWSSLKSIKLALKWWNLTSFGNV